MIPGVYDISSHYDGRPVMGHICRVVIALSMSPFLSLNWISSWMIGPWFRPPPVPPLPAFTPLKAAQVRPVHLPILASTGWPC